MQGVRKPDLMDGGRYLVKQLRNGWNANGGKILTIAGTTGLFFTGVHACRKTYKIHDKLSANGQLIRDAKSKGKLFTAKTAAKCAVKTAKDYAADAVVGALSAYAVAKGWHSEHKHYQQAAAMVGIVMADFMNYRSNVIKEHGKEADRRYLTTKAPSANLPDGKTQEAQKVEGDTHVVDIHPNSLRIWYSKETTPQVWSESYTLRQLQLQGIRDRLDMDLIYGGSYTVNDVRRYFYGRKGDVPEGGMFGRIWDPGDPLHPERGARVNLHYEEDEDFMSGRSDSCYIIIDIDNEPLFELLARKKERDLVKSL